MFTEFVVGRNFPLGDTRGKEGMFFEYGEDEMAYLTICFPDMTDDEVRAIRTGAAKVGIFSYDGIIYIVAKFGYELDGDSCYYVKKYDKWKDIDVEVPDDKKVGLALIIFAVDSRDNTLLGIRQCGMSHRFTSELAKLIEEQKRNPMEFNDIWDKVASARQRWDSNDMMKNAIVTYRLGAKE